MADNLKITTIQGLFWSFFERMGNQVIQLVITVILARLLMPEQFGLIAMLGIFMAAAQSFVDSGFGSALIQKKDVTHLDECSIFYFNIFVGILTTGILCLAAPWIAAFFNVALLVPLTRALSLNLIINAFGLIQTSLLTKRIDFKSQLKVSLIATVLSGIIGIVMAYRGFGVWSLVFQSLSQNLFRTCLLWHIIHWRPSLIFSFDALRSMFTFGSKLLFSGLLDTIFQNIYLVVIGKFFTPADLGFYSKAKRFSDLPSNNISGTVGRVLFPIFSSIQKDKKKLKRGLQRALTTMALFNFPIMIGLAVVAKPLVLVLLTEKWLPCVLYLQLLCFVGLLYPLHAINLNVLKAQGHSDLFLRLEILKKILLVIAIFLTYRWGIHAMIIGQMVTSVLGYYLNCYYTGKLLDYTITDQILDIAPILVLSFLIGVVVWPLSCLQMKSHIILLITQIISGSILFIALCRLLKIPSFMEMMSGIRLDFRKA
jgi:teichuronic acid exporter